MYVHARTTFARTYDSVIIELNKILSILKGSIRKKNTSKFEHMQLKFEKN